MMHAGRRLLVALGFALATLAGGVSALVPASAAQAQGLFAHPKYAAIVVDANTGEVLYADRADALRHPASLTKIMTLYLTFEALSTGRLKMDDVITISPHAFSMMPSKVSTHAGETLTVAEAIPAMTVHSANDVAVAMAERIAGSEAQFARLMTLRAQELGMTNTRFVNASGLPPDGQQISTARDMATLSRAVMRDYPQYYHFFGLKSVVFHGKLLMNHNHLVGRMAGVDGMKTGYTSLAGFNLVASGVREGRRLITVVLGGPSVAARDENVEQLLDAGFAVLDGRARGARITVASLVSQPEDVAGPVQRPPVEMGSGDQPDLQLDVQPAARVMPTLAAAKALDPQPAPLPRVLTAAREATPCPTVGHRRHARRARACETETAAVRVRSETAHETAAAEPACTGRRGRRHHAACKDAAEIADARSSEAGKDSTGGGFMIQVGAYKNRAQAKDHMQAVAGDFGHIVAAASPRLERTGGSYRVRFRGFSEKRARAACEALSARGQQCMVMATS